MGKYKITRTFWHKGYVFLFSYIQNMAMACWSTHKCEEQAKNAMDYVAKFQVEHDKQMDGFVAQAIAEAEATMRNATVDDRTEESRLILKSKS